MYLLKRIIPLIILFVILPLSFYAQVKSFIYIQSEKKQPFYIILDNKTNSSTPEGYIILPQITAGKHLLTIGFPKNLFPEQQFVLNISEDKGYSLKKNNGTSWQLFDLNNYTFINPVTNVDSAMKAPVIKKEDSVEEIHKPNPVPVANAKKEDTIVVKHTQDTIAVAPIKIEKKPDTVVSTISPVKPSSIKLILEKVQATGIDRIYIDSSESGLDTIAVYVPFAAIAKNMVDANGQTIIVTPKQKRILMTEDEFRKTRLDMASALTDDEMIDVALKSTTNKVIETRHLKNLSSLFLNEGKKVAFFKAMKNNLKDPSNFPSLVSELSDTKNIAAFNAISNNQ